MEVMELHTYCHPGTDRGTREVEGSTIAAECAWIRPQAHGHGSSAQHSMVGPSSSLVPWFTSRMTKRKQAEQMELWTRADLTPPLDGEVGRGVRMLPRSFGRCSIQTGRHAFTPPQPSPSRGGSRSKR
jgi:hypothetical protein